MLIYNIDDHPNYTPLHNGMEYPNPQLTHSISHI